MKRVDLLDKRRMLSKVEADIETFLSSNEIFLLKSPARFVEQYA